MKSNKFEFKKDDVVKFIKNKGYKENDKFLNKTGSIKKIFNISNIDYFEINGMSGLFKKDELELYKRNYNLADTNLENLNLEFSKDKCILKNKNKLIGAFKLNNNSISDFESIINLQDNCIETKVENKVKNKVENNKSNDNSKKNLKSKKDSYSSLKNIALNIKNRKYDLSYIDSLNLNLDEKLKLFDMDPNIFLGHTSSYDYINPYNFDLRMKSKFFSFGVKVKFLDNYHIYNNGNLVWQKFNLKRNEYYSGFCKVLSKKDSIIKLSSFGYLCKSSDAKGDFYYFNKNKIGKIVIDERKYNLFKIKYNY